MEARLPNEEVLDIFQTALLPKKRAVFITSRAIISSFMMIMSLLQHSETKIIRWLVFFLSGRQTGIHVSSGAYM